MLITTAINTAGGIVKWGAGTSYEWALIGQCLAAFAKCGYLQAPAGKSSIDLVLYLAHDFHSGC